MKTSTVPVAPIENAAFWRRHYALQQSSGLSRSQYCRKHDVNYDRFSYWIKKLICNDNSESLVSVTVKPTLMSSKQDGLLCTLEFKNGDCLKIHNEQALTFIIARYA